MACGGANRAATATRAVRTVTAVANTPIAGPAAIWPKASAWALMEKTVARTLDSSCELVQASPIGPPTLRASRYAR